MKTPKFGPILLAFLIFCILLFLPNSFLLSLLNDKKLEDAATSLNPNVFQGIDLQKKMLEDPKYLPMYGSSELSRLDVYHPSNYFRVNPDGFTPFLIGRGGTQSLTHFLSLAANADQLEGKKIVFVLSPQWFVAEGLNEEHFAPNFSSIQAYDFLFNQTIDPALKKQAAERLLTFDVVKKDKLLTTMLDGIVYTDSAHTWKAQAAKPLAYMYRSILQRKDFILSLVTVYGRKPNTDPHLKNLTWDQLEHRADQTGKNDSKSNTYGIDDSYYNDKISQKLAALKGYRANESYDVSPEYNDLQMVLDLLKQKHAQALFISVPVNGPWYDYAGFPQERRQSYYKKVTNQIEQSGFTVADFSDHEYDKYFMKDTIHVGWKGWIYIDEAIKQFYDGK
ncbi:D-alanyl-lipoteichoic acid biosynthesis protein DltD [Ectobacillus polymachus]|uniref:D-alanyl-lipoteichoic acid biosynthesis protein DltD n=1 Tax=Ectobacillus polymachus TaxID=1508806 RepID=UPI003A8B47DB